MTDDIERAAAAVVQAWPKLTPEQLDRLTAILSPAKCGAESFNEAA